MCMCIIMCIMCTMLRVCMNYSWPPKGISNTQNVLCTNLTAFLHSHSLLRPIKQINYSILSFKSLHSSHSSLHSFSPPCIIHFGHGIQNNSLQIFSQVSVGLNHALPHDVSTYTLHPSSLVSPRLGCCLFPFDPFLPTLSPSGLTQPGPTDQIPFQRPSFFSSSFRFFPSDILTLTKTFTVND